MHSVIRIGSRESALAVRQAEIIRDLILESEPEAEIEIITMKTTGDKILDKSLEKIGGKGLFVKELDRALMEGRIDLAVHSLKDMPMEEKEELPILAYGKREDPRDVLIYRKGLTELPERPVIGTSSRRRALQMEQLFQGCTFRGIRGNVQTRMRKLEEEGYDATLLAAAGLKRLGMEQAAGRYLSVEEMIPAAGQGILALQTRAGEDVRYLSGVVDEAGTLCATAERAFVRALDGGCSAPIAAHAVIEGEAITLTGLYVDGAGQVFRDRISGPREQGIALAEQLANSMKEGSPCLVK